MKMYPSIVDMNENESSKCLRMLELDAYANILAALRAQGPPSNEKLKLLKDIGAALRIPQERCKAEIRKVILDERLNTIAYFSCGQLETAEEWIKEGRRLISLMPRVAPQTIYSAIADEVADAVSLNNEQLPLSAHDQKRSTPISQVQQSVPETPKSQQYKTPDFKNEESKKRKLSFGIENSSLAQHLIAPSKISRIQQIYRQKVKAKVKEQQLQTKIKQEQEQDLRHLQQQPKLFQQQHFQSKMQKLPLSIQSPTTSNPKINILQNISLTPPNKGEETIEQIKNEVNSFVAQKTEPSRTSPQPGCSNENQAPKQHKQTVVNIKPNSTITYKHVSSPGPSSDLQKSLKVCPTRKTITKPGQKLIIVSNAQSIATSSILQRTLTIPFVKNISVKNFDKFKIVSTSANTNLQLTSLSTNATTFTTNSTKHKVVTVRTNPTTKKMIPLAHLQALNAKGSIKMLPVGGKIFTKTSTTGTAPVYIVNSSGIQPATTKNTSCSSVVMTSRSQEAEKKIEEIESECMENEATEETNDSDVNKSSVLADILKASGVIAPDSESDVEAQIKQFAIIPQSSEVTETQEDFETDANRTEEYQEEDVETSHNVEEQLLEDKDVDTIRLLKDLEGEDSSETVIGNLDPGTGEYTVETAQCEEQEIETTESVTNEPFSLEVQKTANMPDINVN